MEINLNFLNGDNTSSQLHTYWKALPVVAALFAETRDLVCLSGEKKKQQRFYLAEHLGFQILRIRLNRRMEQNKLNTKQTNKSNSSSVQSCSLLFSSFLFHSVYFFFFSLSCFPPSVMPVMYNMTSFQVKKNKTVNRAFPRHVRRHVGIPNQSCGS